MKYLLKFGPYLTFLVLPIAVYVVGQNVVGEYGPNLDVLLENRRADDDCPGLDSAARCDADPGTEKMDSGRDVTVDFPVVDRLEVGDQSGAESSPHRRSGGEEGGVFPVPEVEEQ